MVPERIHTKDHEEAGHRLRKSIIDCWGRGAIGKAEEGMIGICF